MLVMPWIGGMGQEQGANKDRDVILDLNEEWIPIINKDLSTHENVGSYLYPAPSVQSKSPGRRKNSDVARKHVEDTPPDCAKNSPPTRWKRTIFLKGSMEVLEDRSHYVTSPLWSEPDQGCRRALSTSHAVFSPSIEYLVLQDNPF
jgi:hypothetical protein